MDKYEELLRLNGVYDEVEKKKAEDEQTRKLAKMFVDMGVNVDDFLDRLDAQSLYTALMTDSLLPDDEDVADIATTEGEE